MQKLRKTAGTRAIWLAKGGDCYPIRYPAFARATSTSAPGHPIRIALDDLQTRDEVRIIKGKT